MYCCAQLFVTFLIYLLLTEGFVNVVVFNYFNVTFKCVCVVCVRVYM